MSIGNSHDPYAVAVQKRIGGEAIELFITPDLTPLEQKKHKALRQQLADMNKPDKVYMIKNGKIVRRNT